MKANIITSHVFPSIENIHTPLGLIGQRKPILHRLMTYVRIKRQGQYYFVACIDQYETDEKPSLNTGKTYAEFFKAFVKRCYTLQHLWYLDTDMDKLSKTDVMLKCTINIDEEARLKLINKFPPFFGGFNRIETFL